MDANYEVRGLRELLSLVNDSDELFQDITTLAIVFGYGDKFIVLPQVGSKGFLVDSKIALERLLLPGRLPAIDNVQSPLELETARAFDVEKYKAEIIAQLLTDLNFPGRDLHYLAAHLPELSRALNSLKVGLVTAPLFFNVGIAIGELVRLQHPGQWTCYAEIGYGPFYVPYLLGDDKKLYWPFRELSKALEKGAKLNLARVVAAAAIGAPY